MEDAVVQYGLDDITEEEVTLEWETRPLGELPICPHGHSPMTKQQATYTMAGGKFTVTLLRVRLPRVQRNLPRPRTSQALRCPPGIG